MSRRKSIQQNVDVKFKKNLDKLYPDARSMRIKTQKLNSLLEEMLYGKKDRKK